MYIEMHVVVPVVIKMDGFEELKTKGTRWFSQPFYSCIGGYKMCLQVNADGEKDCIGTHITVGTCLMRGEFDTMLTWPFRYTITIQLVNQLMDIGHHMSTISYIAAPDANAAQVTDGERSDGWGKPQFIPHTKLGLNRAKNCQYLKDDCLIFRVISIKNRTALGLQ